MNPRMQRNPRTSSIHSAQSQPAALIAFVPSASQTGGGLSPRLSLVGIAMGALLAVYAFMSVAQACGPAFHPGKGRLPGRWPMLQPNPEAAALSGGLAAMREGRIEDALRIFEKVGNGAWIARLRHQLGQESRAKGRLDAALKHLRAAVAANAEHIGAAADLVRTLALAGRLDEGQRALRGMTAKMAMEPMVVSAKARLLAAAGDVRGAVSLLTSLDRAGRLPTEDRVWMGKLHLRLFKPGALDRQI